MVYLFVFTVFALIIVGGFCLLRLGRIPGWLRLVLGMVWFLVLFFGGFGVLNQWRAADRREALVASCEGNLKKIGAALAQYRQAHGKYPDSIEAIKPLIKEPIPDSVLHCPRQSVVRDRSQQTDPCSDRAQAPEYDLTDCYGKTFYQGDEGPSDYVLHPPAANARPSDILVEEKDYNHPRGWSETPKWKTFLRVDGSVGVVSK